MMYDAVSHWWMGPETIQMQNKSPYSTYFSLPPVNTLHAASVQTARGGSLSAATDWPNHFEITYTTTNPGLEEWKSFSWDLSMHVCDMTWICLNSKIPSIAVVKIWRSFQYRSKFGSAPTVHRHSLPMPQVGTSPPLAWPIPTSGIDDGRKLVDLAAMYVVSGNLANCEYIQVTNGKTDET